MSDSEDRPRSNGRFVAGTVLGVVAGVVLTATALVLVPPKGLTATPTTSTPVVTAPPKTSTAAPTAPGVTPSLPTAQASANPGDLVTPVSGTWIAMLHWMPKATNSLAEASAYARNRSSDTQVVVVIDTDVVQLRGGKAGQYAVAVTGLTAMGDATSTCVALGLTPGSQCGRYQVA